jgi:putative Holliday junction resolvase
MGKIVAFDIGAKRVGVAETDELKMIASRKTNVLFADLERYVLELMEKESPEIIVVGDPKRMNMEPSSAKPFVDKFVAFCRRSFPDVPVELVDERFTSKMASQSMWEAGLGKNRRQQKELIDEVSAVIILQSFLEQQNNRR